MTRLIWRRSRRCDSNTCVEVATADGQVYLRDSKDTAGPVLSFTPTAWRGFIAGVKAGAFT